MKNKPGFGCSAATRVTKWENQEKCDTNNWETVEEQLCSDVFNEQKKVGFQSIWCYSAKTFKKGCVKLYLLSQGVILSFYSNLQNIVSQSKFLFSWTSIDFRLNSQKIRFPQCKHIFVFPHETMICIWDLLRYYCFLVAMPQADTWWSPEI
jgi:hypothetical protein